MFRLPSHEDEREAGERRDLKLECVKCEEKVNNVSGGGESRLLIRVRVRLKSVKLDGEEREPGSSSSPSSSTTNSNSRPSSPTDMYT